MAGERSPIAGVAVMGDVIGFDEHNNVVTVNGKEVALGVVHRIFDPKEFEVREEVA